MENVPPLKISCRLTVPVAEHLSSSVGAHVSDQNPRVTLVSQKLFFPYARGGNALVSVTLIFDGSWVFEGGRWVFAGENAHKNVMIQEGIDFNSFKKVISLKVGDDALHEEWVLSYVTKSKEGGNPIIIADDDDFEAFKFLNSKCGEDLWALAIYVGPLQNEGFEVKQLVWEECLSGPHSSQKVDDLDEIVIDEADDKAQQNPVSLDVVLYAGKR